MIAERIGKAIRNPARDTMLSHATVEMGRGWGFGLHESLDQAGAMIGPLVVAAALARAHGFGPSYAILAIPAAIAVIVLFGARHLYPEPRDFEPATLALTGEGLPRVFWLYLGTVALVAAAYADFPLIAFHFQRAATVATDAIPIFYAVAMGVSALTALGFGRPFDRIGMPTLAVTTLLAAPFAPLFFFGSSTAALIGMALWGVGMGAQDSIMRAAVAGMVPPDRRGATYGLFDTGYGVAWFAGSVVMGILYDVSIPALVVFSVALQLAAVPLLFSLRAREH
jgi:predicted MFS family arabinose efflux permease